MEPQIDATRIILHSRENDSETPVTTSRYWVEIVMNEEETLSSEEMKKSLSDEIQRVMDDHQFTELMRYNAVEFKVVSREVLNVAPAGCPKTYNRELERKMQLAVEHRQEITRCKNTGYWYHFKRGYSVVFDSQSSPNFTSFWECLCDAVKPYESPNE